MSDNDLTTYEIGILRECAGLEPASTWDVAVGQAIEVLRGRGYIGANGNPTHKGWSLLNDELME